MLNYTTITYCNSHINLSTNLNKQYLKSCTLTLMALKKHSLLRYGQPDHITAQQLNGQSFNCRQKVKPFLNLCLVQKALSHTAKHTATLVVTHPGTSVVLHHLFYKWAGPSTDKSNHDISHSINYLPIRLDL
jgi:hypothetical protein